MPKSSSFLLVALWLLVPHAIYANFITANPSNYTTFLSGLQPGDTLYLSAGAYTHNLTINGISGTAAQPIVITGAGDATVIQGQSCCNTVSLTKCAYIVLTNFKLDGLNQFVDAIKAEGTAGNWTHHITIDNLTIVQYGVDQQAVGISTKCPSWDWVVRRNRIIGAGTGMYFGNSDGTRPFVNGLIEYNYVANTVGYNVQVKHQLNGTRDEFPGIAVNGKTIIRYNVFTKEMNASTGGNARPNLLVGGFPTTGSGSMDYYEIYGNFFYQNPVEALFQGTGNINMYDNVFVNHFDPSGFRAVYFTPQNGVSPQDIKVFHNTLWANYSGGGIRLNGPNTAYQQYCYGNAAFCPSAITNFSNSVDNVTDTYANAGNYLLSATAALATLDLYPKSGQLKGTATPSMLFTGLTDWNKDFNAAAYDWTYRGAYAGCCTNPGWQLQLDTMPVHATPTTGVGEAVEDGLELSVFPNPAHGTVTLKCAVPMTAVTVTDMTGRVVLRGMPESDIFYINNLKSGVYVVVVAGDSWKETRRLVVME